MDKSEERKITVMLHCVGEDALEIYNNLNIQYADAQAKKMEEVLTAFRQYCAPRKNTVFERHQFWAYKHNEEAGIDKFVTELRLRARDCEFALVEAEAPDVNTLYIAGITRAHKENSRDTGWSTSLHVGGTLVTFKLDTGAEANVLPLAVAEGLPMPLNMQRTDTVLVAYGGARIQPKGVVKLLVQEQHKQAQLYFFVTDASDTPLLGRQACVQLDLVRRVEALARSDPATKQELLQQYSSVFEGLEEGDLGDEKVIYVATTDPPLGGSITQLVQAASEMDEEMLLLKDLHTAMMYVGWSIHALPARNSCPAIREDRSCRTRPLMLHGRGTRLTSLSSVAGRFY
ncbi:hypothetical protein AAFF_G00198140 [Aldrovandia affinis]|uniref:Peptidase A2 domain-containing protein n=1 Tax=Aldrovandia affinis TaxID=143900 RepID=A0AAD7RIQ3_9TELE|nr:hypothetical protein AAFF_G00198140 [Aldrovandia affinis]